MNKRQKLWLALWITIAIVLSLLTVYGAIQYFSQIETEVPVEQSIWIDGRPYDVLITEPLPSTFGGCTVLANHILENRGDDDAEVEFVLLNVTDSQGNLITDGTVEVSWIVKGEAVDTTIVQGHTTIDFGIAVHFHYAIMPDTYTVNTQVKPS